MISIVDHVQGNVKRRGAEVLQRDDAAWRGFFVVKERRNDVQRFSCCERQEKLSDLQKDSSVTTEFLE
jgi:hypothetical protein